MGALISGVRRSLADTAAVALTFDDGPDPEFTTKVLAALREAEAAATFFVVGELARAHPELVREVSEQGHAVGTHSDTHMDTAKNPARVATLLTDFLRAKAATEAALRTPVSLFRPPYGYLDRSVAIAARRAGMVSWLWTLDTEDWAPGSTAESIAARGKRLVGGDVVLLHDGIVDPAPDGAHDRNPTVEAIGDIVESARRQGLRLVTLAQQTG